MVGNVPLPAVLRAEVKFTTGKTVSIPPRELNALLPHKEGEIGVVAALFWCGDRTFDGRWIMVDAKETFGEKQATVSIDVSTAARIAKRQTKLAPLREYVDTHWPRFLRAFLPQSMESHEMLKSELEIVHAGNGLTGRLSGDDPLDVEHREHIAGILAKHGNGLSGHIFQDLLAYLFGMAGYRSVQINPIGVPDIEVKYPDHGAANRQNANFLVQLSSKQRMRLVALCRAAGEEDLVALLRGGDKI